MAIRLDKSIAHYRFHIANCLAEEAFPQSFSLQVNVQCAMVNEIQA